MVRLSTPPKVENRLRELWKLVEDESEYGQITALQLSKFMNKDVTWVRKLMRNGDLPFAFGDSEAGRASSHIDIVPFWQYMTQGQPVVINAEGGNKDENEVD